MAEPRRKAPNTAPAPLDSRRDAPRTVHSRPIPLQAAPADTTTFLVKFCIAGLVVMIGFIGWALYILTASKGVPPVPTRLSDVPASESVVTSPALPALAASQPALTAAEPAPTAAPAVSDVGPPAATTAATATAATAANAARVVPEAARAGAIPGRAGRERLRPSVRNDRESEAATTSGWTEPSRPSNAGSPPVQDPGPPIAEGPGPRYDYSTPGAAGR